MTRFASRNLRLAFVSRGLLCAAAVLALPGGAQVIQQPHGPFQQPIGQHVPTSADGSYGDFSDPEERLRMLNRERQKSLVSDTNKLLKLANELDKEVQNGNPDRLTSTQLHKIAEIEKLAHNVKDKMSYSVRGLSFAQPMSVPIR